MALSFAILGAGAFGSLVGGRLAETGSQVFLVGRKGHIEAVRKKKLAIDGVRGKKAIAIPGGVSVAEIPFKPDVWVVGLKLADTAKALAEIKDRLDDQSILLTFQNGIPIDVIAATGVRGKIVAAVTGWAATLDGDGAITQTSDGEVVLGGDPKLIKATGDARVQELAKALNAISPTRVVDDIYGHLWIKLLVSMLYAVPAVGGMTFGDVMLSSPAKRVAFRIWTEGYEVATRMGVKIETYLGMLKPEMMVVHTLREFAVAAYVLDMMVHDRKAHRPSVLQDLEKGKITETPYLNGYVVEQARRLGIPTPMNDAVIQMIREIEAKTRRIGKANITVLERVLIFGAEKVGLKTLPRDQAEQPAKA
jgi:2-dehydropantoate 2-reductase